MPIYAYICNNCNNELEEKQGFNDPPLTKCPKCGKNELVRQINKPAVIFKGSGWTEKFHKG